MNADKIHFDHDSLKIRKPRINVSVEERPDTSISDLADWYYPWSNRIIPEYVSEEPKKEKKQRTPEKIKYYAEVWEATEKNAPRVRNIELRGQEYHLDHIVPISYGFKKGINPAIIGGLKNLRIITRKENFKKNCQFVTL